MTDKPKMPRRAVESPFWNWSDLAPEDIPGPSVVRRIFDLLF